MRLAANLFILIVAILHLGFLVLEMFLWNHPVGHKVFAMTPEVARTSEVLAMNQGLYNGFLAAGLLWGILVGRKDVKIFFLSCVVVAGVFGGLTAKPAIIFVQALPALIALVLVIVNSRNGNPAAQRL